jgi:hypothetical protein
VLEICEIFLKTKEYALLNAKGWPDLYTPYTNINEAEASCGACPAFCSVGVWGYFPGN